MQEAALQAPGLSGESPDPKDIHLPVIRPDLEFHRGPRASDGSPTFTIYDPLSRTYNKIGWAEVLLLERMRRPTNLGDVMLELERETTLRLTAEDILAFARDAEGSGLTMSGSIRDVEQLLRETKVREVSPVRWLLFHYLYFRIPLLRPDGFLGRTLPLARVLVSKAALVLYFTLSALGLFFLVERFSSYGHTFTYFFNFQGVLAYGLATIALKAVHEFAHAYTAKALGVRVPSMGVAFIIMWPVAFCDVTDAWKLTNRKQRLSIGIAGMVAETVIAGLALFGWGTTAPGVAHSVFFVISSVTLLSTFLINLNPGMRYDGYYILMDAWGVDNLQPRAFAVARWALRKWLLGVNMEPPETPLGRKRVAAMVGYSLYSWLYRVTLYVSIAALVYFKFTKVVGVFLFSVEVIWFLAMPVIREVKALVKLKSHMRLNPRNALVAVLLLGLIAWFCAPLPRSYSAPGIVVPRVEQFVYAPFSGVIRNVNVKRDQMVKSGHPLLTIDPPELKSQLAELEAQLGILEQQKFLMGLEPDGRALISQKQNEIESVQAQINSLSRQLERTQLVAEVSGQVYEWDEELYEGRNVAKDHVMGRIATLDQVFVYVFVDEDHVGDVAVGDDLEFYPASGEDKVHGVVARINSVNENSIRGDTMLSMVRDDLPVTETSGGTLMLMKAYYLVEMKLADQDKGLRLGQRGKVWLHTPPHSRLMDALRYVYRILIRESGF